MPELHIAGFAHPLQLGSLNLYHQFWIGGCDPAFFVLKIGLRYSSEVELQINVLLQFVDSSIAVWQVRRYRFQLLLLLHSKDIL